MEPKKIFFYTKVVPSHTGSGSRVRVFTNIRAYYDLNYEVIVCLFTDKSDLIIPKELLKARIEFRIIQIKSEPQNLNTLLGIPHPNSYILDRLFPIRVLLKSVVINNLDKDKDALHHFEYLESVSAVYGLNGKFIWSNHDLVEERFKLIQIMREKIGKGKSVFTRYIKSYGLKYSEYLMIKSCCLIFTISNYDQKKYMERFNTKKIKLLPFSWPKESLVTRRREWVEDKRLKILHLGSTNSVLTYSSLKYIFTEIFKILPQDLINKIELTVVGNHPDAPYSNKIRKWAMNYKHVTFCGYQKDLTPYFANHDLQIVGTQVATGIRTKIIESFACGLPVLSSEIGARGLYGIQNAINIILAKKPNEFVGILRKIINGEYNLNEISINARELYDKDYSRKTQATRLREYLEPLYN
ncbi:MAG: glycosyltransferase family 4 protein [Candidatus Marinimicrobia bacterium]|jgi:glycosyltransferase involved in cell wall biosynthesis|nr:glycosyltransferase family 4 protein [Candidatus Neomarinimicrobiota bacterium]MBT3960809.1 glycosyltransferase family 4 protein [Candidatus Neomarinimicrobiota bacterium]MBT4634988.1 glycosyltransferase family 4 protein [Candidatus Neomarinimicrobiota bacterium]MBT4684266.1 glycosyltransferase family 4 protein [Candidatus Neomarinimicrobiota bacterium]MBT4735483.1 glycosyltransferase family 4 protein [Candidatus Neomarinimicrobiota bacterium]